MHPRMRQCLVHLESHAAVPQCIGDVIEVVDDADSSPDDLAALIERDGAMAKRLLEVANSALYSFSGEIHNVRHAVTLLGFDTVRTLATADVLREMFAAFSSSERMLWEHSVISSMAAARLVQSHLPDIVAKDAFVVALLHDVGKIALNNAFRSEYARVSARIDATRVRAIEPERAQFGFDHAELGAEVVRAWGLAPAFADAIRHHHDGEAIARLAEPARSLSALVAVVSACALRLGVGRSDPVSRVEPEALHAWAVLELPVEARDSVFKIISDTVRRGRELLG